MSVISEILKAGEARMRERMSRAPLAEVKAAAADAPRCATSFRQELERGRFGIVAEIKRRSPSTGPMGTGNVDRALDVYRACPEVVAISILTNEDHFGNSLADLRRARALTPKPLLRKDFILDPYQVWEARAAGADAILLMAGLLPDANRSRELFELAKSLGMDVLFEIGMGERPLSQQIAIVPAAAEIFGVNSRHFRSSRLGLRAKLGKLIGKDFWTDPTRHRDLLRFVPAGKIAIAESGVHAPADVHGLASIGYRAVLVGTAFLREGADVEQVVAAFASQVGSVVRQTSQGSVLASNATG
ncbi:MAG: indole-3-glycerol phosphate synthase TrpC [Pseudomonadota bacterium]